MRTTRVWRRVLGVEHTVIESVEFETDQRGQELLVARVQVKTGAARRCSRCRRRCPGYDTSREPRRWRGLDLGTTQVYLQATTSRVSCREHGVVVAAVPWARHGAGHTRFFDDQVAWLAVACSKTAVTELMHIAWRTVGAIVTRVAQDAMAGLNRFAGLRRIGIDEISYNYAGDLVKGSPWISSMDLGSGPVRGSPQDTQDASLSSRSRIPSNIFCRPTWPLVAASSRWRWSVGLNSMVVTKNVQDSQIDSKWQSISTGRAQWPLPSMRLFISRRSLSISAPSASAGSCAARS